MKIDEDITFDHLNPDFSILGEGTDYVKWVRIQPEYTFYLKTKIIDILNSVNESYDPAINFDSVKIKYYMIVKNKVTIYIKIGKHSGEINFVYIDKIVEGVNTKSVMQELNFNNSIYSHHKFLKCGKDFDVNITIDENFNIERYKLIKIVLFNDLDDTRQNTIINSNLDDIIFQYEFTKNIENDKFICVSKRFAMTFHNNQDGDMYDYTDIDYYDDFFHYIFYDLVVNKTMLTEYYPELKNIKLDTDDNFKQAYASLKVMHEKGVFSDKLEDNLNVIKMATI